MATLLAMRKDLADKRMNARDEQLKRLEDLHSADPHAVLSGDDETNFENAETVIADLDRKLNAINDKIRREEEREAEELAVLEDMPARGDDEREVTSLGQMIYDAGENGQGHWVLPNFTVDKLGKHGRNYARPTAGPVAAPSGHGGTGRVVLENSLAGTIVELDTNGNVKRVARQPFQTELAVSRGDAAPGIKGSSTTIRDVNMPPDVFGVINRLFEGPALMRYARIESRPTGRRIEGRIRDILAGGDGGAATDTYDTDGGTPKNTTAKPYGNAFIRMYEGRKGAYMEPTYMHWAMDMFKYGFFMSLTWETGTDITPDNIEAEIQRDAGMLIPMGMGYEIMHSAGTGYGVESFSGNTYTGGSPEGLHHALTNPDTTNKVGSVATVGGSSDGHAPTYDEFVDIQHAIKSPYFMNPSCGFLTNWRNLGAIRKIKDADGHPIFDMDFTGAIPGTILGKFIDADDNFPDFGDNVAAPLIFGAYDYFIVGISGGIRVDRSPLEAGWLNDTHHYRFITRMSSTLLFNEAFCVFNSKNT